MLPERAVELVKQFEGWHRALPDGRAAPYLCPANVWTIGYGATFLLDGSAVTSKTAPITREEGEKLLQAQLVIFERGVLAEFRQGDVTLNANQLGALTSFAFNLGLGRLKSSTLLRHVKAGNMQAAADEFPKWVMAGGQKLPGLVRRRDAERALFLSPVQPQSPQGSAGSRIGDSRVVPSSPGWVGRLMDGFRRGREGRVGDIAARS